MHFLETHTVEEVFRMLLDVSHTGASLLKIVAMQSVFLQSSIELIREDLSIYI